ncbi:hypothetical protein MLD38_021145 [Melastoma candidum]|uniref:Uncharacterized protein n=1 Tax=Melastoma candidum TaxID=119954 RepID=A0ACB9QEK9_9MYRT|nr:hypothetical protein MLD38_021145 [Melastoma candidum]
MLCGCVIWLGWLHSCPPFLYIFIKTLLDNSLAVPTILIAVAGTFKYGERTRAALYLASQENLKKSMAKRPATSHNGGFFNKEAAASHFFHIFIGLVFNIVPSRVDQQQSRHYIKQCLPEAAFDMMMKELDLLYNLFYTKILALKSWWGILPHTVVFYNVVAAVILYSRVKKEGTHEVNIWITFFLLGGILALETFSGTLLLPSDGNNKERFTRGMYYAARGVGFVIPSMVVIGALILIEFISGLRRIVDRNRSERMKLGAFSLISHCVEQCQKPDNKLMDYIRTISCKPHPGFLMPSSVLPVFHPTM